MPMQRDNYNGGWHENPAEVDRILGLLPHPVASVAAPALMDSEPKDFVFKEQGLRKLFPDVDPIEWGHKWDQDGVGSCVGWGWSRAIADLLMIECANDWRNPESFPPDIDPTNQFVAVESVYGPMRVEVGGGRIRGDGGVGAWAAKAVADYGCLMRTKYDGHDLRRVSHQRIKEWGRRGMPDDLEPIARERVVQDVTLMTDVEQVVAFNANGYPTPFCSSRGFGKRGRDGFCPPKGTWHHCLGSGGYVVAKGNKPAIIIHNSWGDYLGGSQRITLESGEEITLDGGTFLADLETIDRMVRKSKDTFGCSGFTGWNVRNWI